jgi:hypothetical protein
MADTGQAILEELRKIRKALEAGKELGFGKRKTPIYVFVKQHQINGQEYVWYQRDKTDKRNIPILERDLSGFIRNVWRHDRIDERTNEHVPKLNIAIHADQDYVLQTGFYTNFSKSLMAALLELEPEALKEPLTLVVETNEGSRYRPTLFCRLEWRGKRLTPDLGKDREHKALYQQVVERFGFHNPYELEDR